MIVLNGHKLTTEEGIALRAAITAFRMSLTKEIETPVNYHRPVVMTAIARNYNRLLERIGRLLESD